MSSRNSRASAMSDFRGFDASFKTNEVVVFFRFLKISLDEFGIVFVWTSFPNFVRIQTKCRSSPAAFFVWRLCLEYCTASAGGLCECGQPSLC